MICDILLVDLGDVLCTWDPKSLTALTPSVMRSLMHSETWYGLERGETSFKETCQVWPQVG